MSERILLIIESPNKVKTIKPFLPSNYVVMASFGHISQIKDGGNYWNTGIDPKNNFKANFAVSSDKDTQEHVKSLKEQVKLADKVVLASDPDREGEAIAWSLKKFLSIPDKKYERVTFHEITKNAVLKALEHPRKIDDDLVSSAHTRAIEDKIIGFSLSSIARKQIQAKSVGRCQSAGLKLICDRDEEFNNFISKKYYELWLHFVKNNTEFKAKYVGTKDNKIDKIFVPQDAQDVVDSCEPPFVISNVEHKDKKEYPKAPFTTSTFQQEVSSKLGVSVKKSMEIAQRLFEGIDVGNKHIALITYIRTDSPEFAPEFLPLLENYVKSTYGNDYYAPIREAKKQENAQDGHEAIRCVDLEMTPELLSKYITDKTLLKVYDIIYKRTIATMMKPSITSETIYTISSGKHLFEFTSREERFDGFKKVYRYDDEKDEVIKETFEKDEQLKAKELEIVEKETKPRPRFKENTFIKELEATGIGRPSTFEKILSTLLDTSRGYCVIEDEFIIPTEKGIALSHFLDDKFPSIINLDYTREMEKDLDEIATGKRKSLDVLQEFYEKLEKAIKDAKVMRTTEMSDEVCPECGAPMVIRSGQYGRFLGCSRYPKCKSIKKLTE